MNPHKSDTHHTLWLLIQNKSMTSIQLKKITKASYPPARIMDLKNLGLEIIPGTVPYVNRRGKKSKIAKYTLATPKKEAVKIYKKMTL